MFAHFWLRQCRMVLRPHLYCLPSRFTIMRYLYWFLGLCGIWFCEFRCVLFSPMVHTLRDGVTPAGSRLVCPRSERRFSVFSLSLRDEVTIWVRCWLGARRLSWVLHPFSLWLGFEPLSEASFRALSYRCFFLVVLAGAESLRLSLALSSVLPCPMLWLHVRLHDPCSGSEVVLGAFP